MATQEYMTSRTYSATIGGDVYNVTTGLAGYIELPTSMINAIEYGAAGNGSTDDAASIQAALDAAEAAGGARVCLDPGTFLIRSGLTIAENVALVGAGGQRATTITKGFSGTAITMESLSMLHDVNIEGDGANYTGRGVYCTVGYSQSIERVRINDTEAACLEFALDVGGGAVITGLNASTSSPSTVPAIKVISSAGQASPKFFYGTWLPGGSVDIGANASTGFEMVGFYITSIITTSATDSSHFSNGRLALVGAAMTISGSNLKFSSVSFAGDITLDNCVAMSATGCVFDSIVETAGTCYGNDYVLNSTVYTPVWDQASGTQPAIGNGTIAGTYCRNGATCTVSVILTAGGSTTYGNNTTAYRISLPFRGDNSGDQNAIPVRLVCAGTLSMTWAAVAGDQAYFTMGDLGGSVRLGYPGAWASGDSIQATFTYAVR